MVDIQTEQGEWLSLVEASRRLGQSVQTLRRRVKDQKIPARQATTSHGIAWQVWVAEDIQPQEGERGEDTQAFFEESNQAINQQAIQEYATLGVLELISWLQKTTEENKQLSNQVGNLEAELRNARSQLDQAQETIKALEAPKPEVQEPEPIRPWWKFW